MCDCTSCKETDRYAGLPDLLGREPFKVKGFADWPRGEPAGQRSSEAAYRAHRNHCNALPDHRPLEKHFPVTYPAHCHGVAPIARNATAVRWNAGRTWQWAGPIFESRPVAKKAKRAA